jgi:hypothetical protein
MLRRVINAIGDERLCVNDEPRLALRAKHIACVRSVAIGRPSAYCATIR